MVRNLIRNQAPGNRLRVRIPCPPLRIMRFPSQALTQLPSQRFHLLTETLLDPRLEEPYLIWDSR